MVSQSNLIQQGGLSSVTKRRLDLEAEDEIIRIPACDLTTTFDEIAKALGKRLTLDATNARLQVSIDAEKPLQFERRVGFPNGDIGKVSLEYEGLSRHCFGCRRITHDIYSCPELSTEEREQKIKEFRELNQNDTLPLQFNNRATLSIRSNNTSNKRPRSSSDDELRRSSGRTQYPGNSRDEKRRKDIGSYWSSRNHGDDREDRTHTDRRRDDKLARLPVRNATVWNRLENRQEDILREVSASQNRRYDRPRELSKYRSNDRYQAPYSRHSQQVWRPRSQANDSRSNNQTRSIAVSGNRAQDVREVTDTQRTISEVFPRRGTREIQGNGVMVVHRDETPEERMRRLKGKAPMFDEALENTPISAEKRLPAGLLTRDRGIIRIRDEENPVQTEETRYVSPLDRSSSDHEVDNLELDRLMESKQIDDMVMTKEDEAEVDRLVEDFGDVVMDDDMMQNDDLLVDEPGFDAEKIDAISQLSPANAARKDKGREEFQRVQDNTVSTQDHSGGEGTEQAQQLRKDCDQEATTVQPAGERSSSIQETESSKGPTVLQTTQSSGYF
ncbi:hypothetical protein Bca101_048801 [Brassica carinata]